MLNGWIAAALTIVIWGMTFASTRMLLSDFSAFEIIVIRFVMAWLTLAALCGFRLRVRGGEMYVPGEGWRLRRWNWRDELICAALGFTGLFANQFLENAAIYYTNASNVVILVSFGPIMTAVLARFVNRDHSLSLPMVLGSLVAMGGVVLVSFNGVKQFHLRPFGDVLALAAMMCWALYSLIVDRANARGIPAFVALRKAFFWSLVMMLPVIVWGTTEGSGRVFEGSFTVVLDRATNIARFAKTQNWIHLVFLGVFASAICYSLWSVACRRLGMVRTTMGLYLLPVIGVAFAVVFLGERVSVMGVLGGILILAGVLAANGRMGKSKNTSETRP